MAFLFCNWNYTNKTSSLTYVLMYLGLSTNSCELIQGLHKKNTVTAGLLWAIWVSIW